MALSTYAHTIAADDIYAIVQAPTTPSPKFAYVDRKRTDDVDEHADGWGIHQLRDIPVAIGQGDDAISANATIQLAEADEIPAGSIIRPTDDAQVRLRGVSGEGTTFVELIVTVVAEEWEIVGNVADAFTGAASTTTY